MVQGDGEEEQLYYLVKHIKFRRSESLQADTVPILLQDVNGPCPILAIFNILLLRGQVQLPHAVGEVSQSKVLQMLAEYLLDKNQALEDSMSTNDTVKANLQYNLADSISMLPRLTTGVDVNVRFNDIRGIEFTADVAVFDLLGIDLVHGWLVDPQDIETSNALGKKTYNEVVCDVITTLGAASLSRNASNQHEDVASSDPVNVPGDISQSELTEALASLLTVHANQDENNGDGSHATPGESIHGSLQSPSLVSQDSVTKAVNSMLHDTVKDIFKTPRDLSRGSTMEYNSRDSMEKSPPMKTLSSSLESRSMLDEKAKSALVAKDFLEMNGSQLTVYGLSCLLEGLVDGQLAVFFRNNHFNVILKHKGCLYILVTDQGYHSETDVVWEAFTSVAGDTEFVTWDFSSFEPHKDVVENGIPPEFLNMDEGSRAQEDADFTLAMQLQEEEQARVLAERELVQHASQEQQRNTVKKKKSICMLM